MLNFVIERQIMAGIRESTAEETQTYQTEPAIVAQACQDALNRIGKVTEVSRETGMITGKINTGLVLNNTNVVIRISKKGDLTELSIRTNRGEGLITGNGAVKGLTMFMQALGEDARLKGKSTGGW
jgi:hypothetical protein